MMSTWFGIKTGYDNMPCLERWHSHLGHPSLPIVERVISSFNLPCASGSNKDFVCDACQRAKSHRLPYPKTNSVSSHPLELIYSDVWGCALKSASGKLPGSRTPGTSGHQLRPNNMDMTACPSTKMAGEPYTLY
jgi:hypothetical protein